MKKKDNLFQFLIIVFFINCTPMDETVPDFYTCGFRVKECDPTSFTPDTLGLVPIMESNCVENLGAINLLEDSKKYLWFHCPSVNALIYEDSLGNQIFLDIISKIHKRKNTYRYSYSKPGCAEFIYASMDEEMEITLANQPSNIKFKLVLAPGGTAPKNYDGLAVNKTTFDDERPFWTNEVLFMYLNNRDPNSTIVRFRYNKYLDIQGTLYKNVYWNNGRHNVPMEIYYNQDCGIIAFRDDQGTLWRLAGYK